MRAFRDEVAISMGIELEAAGLEVLETMVYLP